MTIDRETVIRLANVAGVWIPMGSEKEDVELKLERFARSIEREAITEFLRESGQYLTNDATREAAIREATAPMIERIKMDEALMRQAFDALEESRDDVVSSLNNLEHGRGYPSYDRRIQRITEQLSKHDAALEALRQRLEAKK